MTLRAVVMMALVVACAAPVFSAGNVVTIEKGGRLLLNGKRFFPLGLYAKPSGADPYKQMAEAGFNLVSSGFDVQALEAAAKAGVYCWIPLGEAADLSGDREKRESRLREIVTGAKAHPALLMYESVDEPAWTWNEPAKARVGADGLALGYRLVKSLDPNHPVTMNHAPQNTVETLRKYNAACDTVSVDIYPIVPRDILYMYGLTRDGRHGDLRNQTPSCVGEYVDKMRKVAGPDRPVWMVLQGFAAHRLWHRPDP